MKVASILARPFLGTVMVLVPVIAAAQDPVKISPEIYKVTVDNASVRALEVRIPVGAKSPMHSHPASVVAAFSPCKVKFTSPDGKSREVEFKVGDTVWRNAETHAAENVGTAECHALQVELKKTKPMAK